MVSPFHVLVFRRPTECGEELESLTTGAFVWGRIQTGIGDSTGTPPTDLAPTPVHGTSWALTHSLRWARNLPPLVKRQSSDWNCECSRLPSGAQGPVEVLHEPPLLWGDGAATLGLHRREARQHWPADRGEKLSASTARCLHPSKHHRWLPWVLMLWGPATG